MRTLLPIMASLGFAIGEMCVTWVIARRIRNYSIVDGVWSAGFAWIATLLTAFAVSGFSASHAAWIGLAVAAASLVQYRFGHNALKAAYWLGTLPWLFALLLLAERLVGSPIAAIPTSSLVLLFLVLFWSSRLAWHLARRIASHHPTEDVRYAKLRTDWATAADSKMFWFYQLQGLLQVVLCLPFFLALTPTAIHPPSEGWWRGIGLCLWAAGILGESVADAQLARFRADTVNRGRVCEQGLWYYSRHPNYFFEWLIWLGYAVFATPAPWGWLAYISPTLMLHFLLNVTGIPMTEVLSLQSKGDAYRAYQRTTSAFVPWFKKRI